MNDYKSLLERQKEASGKTAAENYKRFKADLLKKQKKDEDFLEAFIKNALQELIRAALAEAFKDFGFKD